MMPQVLILRLPENHVHPNSVVYSEAIRVIFATIHKSFNEGHFLSTNSIRSLTRRRDGPRAFFSNLHNAHVFLQSVLLLHSGASLIMHFSTARKRVSEYAGPGGLLLTAISERFRMRPNSATSRVYQMNGRICSLHSNRNACPKCTSHLSPIYDANGIKCTANSDEGSTPYTVYWGSILQQDHRNSV